MFNVSGKTKKICGLLLGIAILFLIAGTGPVLAQRPLEINYPEIFGQTLPANASLPDFIKYFFNFSLIAATVVAFGMMVFSGFRYVTSVGNSSAQKDARDRIVAAFLGLIILLASFIILTTINPQLAILKLPGINQMPIVPPPIPLEYTPKTNTYQEIPTGKFIDTIIDENRLRTVLALTDSATRAVERLKILSDEFKDELNRCSCGRGTVVVPVCGGGGCTPQPSACGGEVCDRDALNRKKLEIEIASRDLQLIIDKTKMIDGESGIKETKDLFARDVRRLERSRIAMKGCDLQPLSYDNMIGLKDIGEAGINIVPWIDIKPGIDAATFYCNSAQVIDFAANEPAEGVPPGPPAPPPTDFSCDACVIPIKDTNGTPAGFAKDYFAQLYPSGKINAQCPEGLDCWDYVIQQAQNNGWNPLVLLALWGEESHFSAVSAWDLGCVYFPDGTPAPQNDVVAQVNCVIQHDDKYNNWCTTGGRTEFCSFMRYWSGGASCTLSNNPNFYPNFYVFYTQLAEPGSPQYPSGSCNQTPPPPPPPPPPSGCPSTGNLAELRLYIKENYNVEFRGDNWPIGALNRACNKFAGVSNTNFDEMLRNVRDGAGNGAIVWYIPGAGTGIRNGTFNVIDVGFAPTDSEYFSIILLHELGHVIRAAQGWGNYLDEMQSVASADKNVRSYYDGLLTRYPYQLCTYPQITDYSRYNENFAETITYYLHPGAGEQTAMSCSDRNNIPFSGDRRPNHCSFARNLLGNYASDCNP